VNVPSSSSSSSGSGHRDKSPSKHHHHHGKSSSHVKRLFKKFDRDGSGVLEGKEIREFMKHYAVSASNEERRSLAKKLDGKKKLTRDEFESLMRDAERKKEAKKSELKAAFKRFDKDRNGTIEGSELKALLDHMVSTTQFKSRREALKQLDTNRDGKISFAEFCVMLKTAEERAKSEKDAVRAFDRFDKDGSGLIEPKEFRAFLESISLATSGEQRVKLQQALGNGQGAFDKAMWVKVYLSSLHSARLREQEVKRLFKQSDADQSGELSRSEVRALLPKIGIDIDEKELKRLFAETDESGDGRLQLREFRELLFKLQFTW
jgi:Ca2+-binding EF-hand superfamily protein